MIIRDAGRAAVQQCTTPCLCMYARYWRLHQVIRSSGHHLTTSVTKYVRSPGGPGSSDDGLTVELIGTEKQYEDETAEARRSLLALVLGLCTSQERYLTA